MKSRRKCAKNNKIGTKVGNSLATIWEDVTLKDVYSAEMEAYITNVLIQNRLRLGYNRKQFAKYLEVPLDKIIQWEDETYNFTLDELASLCEKLNLKPKVRLESVVTLTNR